jgi:hypothetical protein
VIHLAESTARPVEFRIQQRNEMILCARNVEIRANPLIIAANGLVSVCDFAVPPPIITRLCIKAAKLADQAGSFLYRCGLLRGCTAHFKRPYAIIGAPVAATFGDLLPTPGAF